MRSGVSDCVYMSKKRDEMMGTAGCHVCLLERMDEGRHTTSILHKLHEIAQLSPPATHKARLSPLLLINFTVAQNFTPVPTADDTASGTRFKSSIDTIASVESFS